MPEPTTTSPSKVCSDCKRDLPLSQYHRDATHRDGLKGICKECKAKQSAARREREREEGLLFVEEPPSLDPTTRFFVHMVRSAWEAMFWKTDRSWRTEVRNDSILWLVDPDPPRLTFDGWTLRDCLVILAAADVSMPNEEFFAKAARKRAAELGYEIVPKSIEQQVTETIRRAA